LTPVVGHIVRRQTDGHDVGERVGCRVARPDGELDGRLQVAQQNEDDRLQEEIDRREDTDDEEQSRANMTRQNVTTTVHVDRETFLYSSHATRHTHSGPARATGQLCVCVCLHVRIITFYQDDH